MNISKNGNRVSIIETGKQTKFKLIEKEKKREMCHWQVATVKSKKKKWSLQDATIASGNVNVMWYWPGPIHIGTANWTFQEEKNKEINEKTIKKQSRIIFPIFQRFYLSKDFNLKEPTYSIQQAVMAFWWSCLSVCIMCCFRFGGKPADVRFESKGRQLEPYE